MPRDVAVVMAGKKPVSVIACPKRLKRTPPDGFTRRNRRSFASNLRTIDAPAFFHNETGRLGLTALRIRRAGNSGLISGRLSGMFYTTIDQKQTGRRLIQRLVARGKEVLRCAPWT